MVKTAAVVPEEQHFILSSLSPGRAQKRLALAVVLALLVAFFITAGPLSTIHLGRIDAFVPTYATALFVIDLITAVLLFAQFSILRSLALLAIASGYLFTALMVIPWMLTFPGVFTPGGLLGAGLQTTNWLYILRHAGFPMFVIAYALLKDADPDKRVWRGSTGTAILLSVAMTAAVVCAATFLVTAGEAHLPRTMLDPARFSTLRLYIAGYQILLSVAAFIVLWVRRSSVLDLWLMVVMCAYVVEVCLIAFPVPVRFSFGWYAGRICGLLSGSLVLFVLLYEITKLYAQLVRAVFARAELLAILDKKNQALEAANAELAQRSQELARSNAELEQMASIASHDLQEPLRMVGSYMQLLKRKYQDRLDADGHEFIGFAVDGTKRMQALIDDLLTYSRVGSGATPLQPTDCNAVVAAAQHSLHMALEESGAQVECGALPVVMGDAVQLTQLFQNLLANAIKFRRNLPPEIHIHAEPEDGFWRFAVQDNGIGIAPEYFEQIFVMFQRLHSRSTYPGTGIGLAICKKIVERHGGCIWMESMPGTGSTFQFTLPREKPMGTGRRSV
ncbi:MAG TPA: MASE4 domain-containing protein [Janthinobacterium sp.]|nr:MASE4 domain-containing protein [Janthinobacterium sp.]